MQIKVNKLCGRGRIQYTREPFTHWSFAFFEEPVMEFDVASRFEGRGLPGLSDFLEYQVNKIMF